MVGSFDRVRIGDGGQPLHRPGHSFRIRGTHRPTMRSGSSCRNGPADASFDFMINNDHEIGSHPPFGCPNCGAELTLIAASDFHEIGYEIDGPMVSVPKKIEWKCANGHLFGMQVEETFVDDGEYLDD